MKLSELSNKIINYRAQHNISQVDFAKLCKISQQTACNVENGVQKPSKITLKKILNVIEGD